MTPCPPRGSGPARRSVTTRERRHRCHIGGLAFSPGATIPTNDKGAMYGLGATAHWVAAVPATATRRPDALFGDPWAAALAGEDAARWAGSRPPESLAPMVIRTRFFDDFLRHATFEEGMAQVVLLGAGLDTRALRLPWLAGTAVFEVDQPGVLDYKEDLLAGADPSCDRQVCGQTCAAPAGPPSWPTLASTLPHRLFGWQRGSSSICPMRQSGSYWNRFPHSRAARGMSGISGRSYLDHVKEVR